ncbi:hypothetical protein [Zongyangia hominis]|uniref:Uncharacterized protein n=1 Tax=Zongyangia hominis TaxID=2763677 RepID=A0A926IBB5_9FIRM|nr:hypothetical protein [Zongyangia hominis]MBC8570002.1 hypothetical protein [Zongyangia hominis]
MEKCKRVLIPLFGILLIASAFFFYSTVSGKAREEEKIPEQVVLPEYIRPQIKGWAYTEGLTLESECKIALVPGGETASLELYVDAPQDENGAIIYDDGQEWTLVLRKGGYFYPLLKKQYIQNGKVYYNAYYSYEDNAFHILVMKDQRADLDVYECVYDVHEDAFEVREAYKAKDIVEVYKNY